MCQFCNKRYKELPVVTFIKDGYKYSYDRVDNCCDKCLLIHVVNKERKKQYIVQALNEGKITLEILQQYRDKKISTMQLDEMIRHNELGKFKNPTSPEEIQKEMYRLQLKTDEDLETEMVNSEKVVDRY